MKELICVRNSPLLFLSVGVFLFSRVPKLINPDELIARFNLINSANNGLVLEGLLRAVQPGESDASLSN